MRLDRQIDKTMTPRITARDSGFQSDWVFGAAAQAVIRVRLPLRQRQAIADERGGDYPCISVDSKPAS